MMMTYHDGVMIRYTYVMIVTLSKNKMENDKQKVGSIFKK